MNVGHVSKNSVASLDSVASSGTSKNYLVWYYVCWSAIFLFLLIALAVHTPHTAAVTALTFMLSFLA